MFEWTKKPYRQAPKNRDKSITENSKVSDDTILASNTGCIYTDCSVQTEDTNVTVADGTTQTVTYTTSDVSIQHSPDLEDHFTQTYVSVNHTGTMTEIDVMDSSPFRIQQIKDDNEAIKFYTGFISFSYFMACFNFLGSAVTTLCYNNSKNGNTQAAVGRPHSLSPLNEFFLTMCRLRLGLKEVDLSYRFQVAQSTVSRICNTWIAFLFYKFKEIPLWPTRDTVDHHMPTSFRSMYPKTRCIIDATELFIPDFLRIRLGCRLATSIA